MFDNSDQLYTSGRYLQQNPGWHEEGSKYKADLVLQMIKKIDLSPGLIVDVGCGAGAVLLELAKHLPVETQLHGYDISPDAIKMAMPKATSRLKFYLEDYTRIGYGEADIVLLLDVIEHVDDNYSFLRRLRDKGRNFIFHIPLDMSCRTLLKPHTLLQQRSAVGHIHYFTEEPVLWMLADTGYKVQQYIYTKPEIDLVKPKSVKQWTKKWLRRISYGISKKWSVKLWGNYSMMIWAKPITNKNDENTLAL
jgi:2-polyprenyl-3-methyl-5-hydroxy-6-metoxy-1,4-benzoquinol methylase